MVENLLTLSLQSLRWNSKRFYGGRKVIFLGEKLTFHPQKVNFLGEKLTFHQRKVNFLGEKLTFHPRKVNFPADQALKGQCHKIFDLLNSFQSMANYRIWNAESLQGGCVFLPFNACFCLFNVIFRPFEISWSSLCHASTTIFQDRNMNMIGKFGSSEPYLGIWHWQGDHMGSDGTDGSRIRLHWPHFIVFFLFIFF